LHVKIAKGLLILKKIIAIFTIRQALAFGKRGDMHYEDK